MFMVESEVITPIIHTITGPLGAEQLNLGISTTSYADVWSYIPPGNAAFAPQADDTPPPGCVEEPHM